MCPCFLLSESREQYLYYLIARLQESAPREVSRETSVRRTMGVAIIVRLPKPSSSLTVNWSLSVPPPVSTTYSGCCPFFLSFTKYHSKRHKCVQKHYPNLEFAVDSIFRKVTSKYLSV